MTNALRGAGVTTLAALALLLALAATLLAAPADAATSNQGDSAAPWPLVWNPYLHSDGTTINDVNGEISPTYSDIASGACVGANCVGPDASVFYYSDGTNSFFRLRLATDPTDLSKGGIFGNAFIVQIAQAGVVKAVVGVNGKDNTHDFVYVTDSVGGVVTPVYTFPWDNSGGQNSEGARIVAAGGGQYYLDFQVPISYITTASSGSINAATPIQIYFGTSQAANLAVINKDYMEGAATSVSFANLSTISLEPADVTLSSSAESLTGPNPPAEGVTSRYKVTVTASNPGGSVLSNTVVTIPLGAGMTASELTTAAGSLAGTGPLTWTIGSLLSGQSVTATFVLTFTPGTGSSGTQITLVEVQDVAGDDLSVAAQRTDTAAAITVGPVAVPPPTYLLSFDPQGGSVISDANVIQNELAGKPSDPTRSGYRFVEWTTDPEGTTPWDFDNDLVTGDMTLYGQWVQVYPITFDSQGGSSVDGQEKASGETVDLPTDPTRFGYTFGGWCVDSECTTLWDFTNDTVTGSTTLYAKWTANQYSVTFDPQGGSAVSGQTVSHGSTVTEPANPTRDGYRFDGWTLNAGGTSPFTFSTPIVTDITLYAQWTPVYTVSFDPQGGSAVDPQAVPDGDPASAPTDPTKDGYTFEGWCVDSECTSLWDFTTPVTGAVTLYAKWKLVHKVVFAPQNGQEPTDETVDDGSTPSTPPTPTRAGYRFLGWYTAPTGGTLYDPTAPVTGEVTLYAQWEVYSADEPLASTGATSTGLLWIAASLVAVGAGLVGRTRRRVISPVA